MINKLSFLLIRMESLIKMEFNEPATSSDINKLKNKYRNIPDDLVDILRISDGMEINVPGTIIYSIKDMEKNFEKENAKVKQGYFPFARMSFGDLLLMKTDGGIIQLNHETNEEFLEWSSIVAFLEEELINGYEE